jgi:tRNA A37 threonylcarbamoyladenosine dehydratase
MPGEDKPTEAISVRLLDNALSTWPLPRLGEEDALLFSRQPLAEGAALRLILRNTSVAVVGLSGGGSQVVSQLAALGIGEIIGIDNQTVDDGNRFAPPNLGWFDALMRLRKATAAKMRTWIINRDVRFSAVKGRVPEPHVVEALKRADIIIGCVNIFKAVIGRVPTQPL